MKKNLFIILPILYFLIACSNHQETQKDKQLETLWQLKSQLPERQSIHFDVVQNTGKIPCPKLLPISAHRPVTHYHDKMMSDTCDYYLYPKMGQFLYVGSSSPTISAKLISPAMHDFKNGAIQVEDSGRYVVRLTRSYHFGMSDISLLHSLKVVVGNRPPQGFELQHNGFGHYPKK